MVEACRPYVARGLPVVGLEPSCLLTLRDEFLALGLGEDAKTLAANAFLFEEFLAREHDAGRLKLKLAALPQKKSRTCPAAGEKRRLKPTMSSGRGWAASRRTASRRTT